MFETFSYLTLSMLSAMYAVFWHYLVLNNFSQKIQNFFKILNPGIAATILFACMAYFSSDL